jgi:ribosomal protein S8
MIKNLNIIYVFIEYTGPKKCEPIRKIIRLSKPSLRRFISVKTLTQATYKTHFMNGNSLCIISTSKGLMLDNQAQQLKIGGELMFLIA